MPFFLTLSRIFNKSNLLPKSIRWPLSPHSPICYILLPLPLVHYPNSPGSKALNNCATENHLTHQRRVSCYHLMGKCCISRRKLSTPNTNHLNLGYLPPKLLGQRTWLQIAYVEIVTGSVSEGVWKWDREGRKTKKLYINMWNHSIQLDFSFTEDQLTNHLKFYLNSWGSWSIYPPSLVSYLLKFAPKGIKFLTCMLPYAWIAYIFIALQKVLRLRGTETWVLKVSICVIWDGHQQCLLAL